MNNANEAQLDEGNHPGQVGPCSVGQGPLCLSSREDAVGESVEELAATDQALESAAVEGSEHAAAHPERPGYTHTEYGRPHDLPPPAWLACGQIPWSLTDVYPAPASNATDQRRDESDRAKGDPSEGIGSEPTGEGTRERA
jgi:hypothetical protein